MVLTLSNSTDIDCQEIGINHIAIIMDGNGRWANAQGATRLIGHARGVESVKRVVQAATDINLPALTLYSFSTENWSRPKAEVQHLMSLLKKFLNANLRELKEKNVRIRVIGDRKNISEDILDHLSKAELETQENTGLDLCIAFNYGGRDEIVRAVTKLAKDVLEGKLSLDDIEQGHIAERLDCPDIPDPDLVIRTSGEQRISNFLIWQSAYSEFVFLEKNWPDFQKQDLIKAVEIFRSRDRRFGSVKSKAV